MLIGVTDRYEVDARCAEIEIVGDLEIDEKLFDLGRSMQLIVRIEGGAGVLEFDLGIENYVLGDLVGRQQNEAARIEPVLPLSVGIRVLQPAKVNFAISAEL